MFKLRTGYLVSGIATGLVLLVTFFWSLPDGKLHITFCDVGQGDGAYVRFPDGRDMVVDGGPNNTILNCLGRHMPFWDRHINIVLMTHPQKDHMQGLIDVFSRYSTDYFVRSDIDNTTEGYQKLLDVVARRRIKQQFVTTGEHITVGTTTVSVLWPSSDQVARGKTLERSDLSRVQGLTLTDRVLGSTVKSPDDLNDYSIVFWLRYGTFDAVFTGDADSHVEDKYVGTELADATIEVLKVPHHGSKTGMTDAFIAWLHPELAVISVGKNSYGHPSDKALLQLKGVGSRVKRTDESGDVEVVSDGSSWKETTAR